MIEKILINDPESKYYSNSDSKDGFLLTLPEKCTLKDFFTAAKVKPNSYGSILVSRLFHGLMTTSTNVNEEYNKYYSKEYKNLDLFLFWKYCIPLKTSKKVISELHQGEIVLYSPFSSGCSWTVQAFIDDPVMLKSLNIIIDEVRRMHYENSR